MRLSAPYLLFLLTILSSFAMETSEYSCILSDSKSNLTNNCPFIENDTSYFCGTNNLSQQAFEKDAFYQKKAQLIEDNYLQFLKNKANNQLTFPKETIVLPIVVHIVYGNLPDSDMPNPIGTGENLSEADVQLGVDYINRAFAGQSTCKDSITSENMGIQFALAKRDINHQWSNGITRHYSPNLTEHDQCTKDEILKNLSQVGGQPYENPWPSTDYINVWLVKRICNYCYSNCNVTGYSTLAVSHGTAIDGFVGEAQSWATNCKAPKVNIHEMGHYLNLFHTFKEGCKNNDCLKDGDRVCDTPPDNNKDSNRDCNPINSCSTDVYSGFEEDQADLTDNYMDYGKFSCLNAFTNGQKERMLATLHTKRSSLLNSKAFDPPCGTPLKADFSYLPNKFMIKTNTVVNFTNNSKGQTSIYRWYINDSLFSEKPSPSHVFHQEGTLEIKLLIATPNDICPKDSIIKKIRIDCHLSPTFEASLANISTADHVDFINTTTGDFAFEWLIDGISQGNEKHLKAKRFRKAGISKVQLVANDGICTDTSTLKIRINNCTNKKHYAIWYFGVGVGLDFNTSPPTVLEDYTNYFSRVAIMSDDNGDLLFYTNGSRVWDKNHQLMPNGENLNMHDYFSNSSGVSIVPDSGNSNRYYIFSIFQKSGKDSLHYSKVDMTLNKGLGDISPNSKGKFIGALQSNKLATIKHCNRKNTWVISLQKQDAQDGFHVSLVNESGVHFSSFQRIEGENHINNTCGHLISSPDGRRIAMSNCFDGLILFNFDNKTGEISEGKILDKYNHIKNICFSSDGSKLYGINYGGEIHQFDIQINDTLHTLIKPSSDIYSEFGAIQLAIDSKIYLARARNLLAIINAPNETGLACDFSPYGLNLGEGEFASEHLPIMSYNIFADEKPVIKGPKLVSLGDQESYFIDRESECAFGNYYFYHTGKHKIIGQTDTSIRLRFDHEGYDTIFVTHKSTCKTQSAYFPVRITKKTDFDSGIGKTSISTKEKTTFSIRPNPIKQTAQISYQLTEKATIDLQIFDYLGRLVATPLVQKSQKAGRLHQLQWATDQLPIGVYYYQFKYNKKVLSGKVAKF